MLISESKRILIVRLSAFGDVVNTLPAVAMLRRQLPDVFIAWAVQKEWKTLVDSFPAVNLAVPFDKKEITALAKSPFSAPKSAAKSFEFVRRLLDLKFDTAIDFQGNLKSGMVAFASGAELRAGFSRSHSKELNFLFINKRLSPGPAVLNRVERNIGLVGALGADTTQVKVEFHLPPEIETAATGFLRAHMRRKKYFVIHPGTSRFGSFKRWPIKNFADLADMAVSGMDMDVLITWSGSEEFAMAKEMAEHMRNVPMIAPPTDDIRFFMALIKRSTRFVGADTGPLHLAAAMGVPCVAIFGPKDPRVYAPFGPEHVIVVKKGLKCRPCTKRSCEDPVCVTSITAEETFEAMKR